MVGNVAGGRQRMTQAWPLHWPMGFPREKSPRRSQFRTSLDTAVANVNRSLRAFAKDSGRDIVNFAVSSNVTMMSQEPKDAGVAAYFRWDNIDCCIAVDRYLTPAENLQAIVHVIEAERTKLRHGGLNIVRAGFRGFAALPPPKGPDGQLAPPWRTVLFSNPDVIVDLAAVEAKHRELVKEHHPDRGGDAARFNQIIDAVRQAREELKP